MISDKNGFGTVRTEYIPLCKVAEVGSPTRMVLVPFGQNIYL